MKATYLDWYSFQILKKTFDSINQEYMFKCLRHFNFKNDLVNWVTLLYKNAKSCVTNNGHHSDFYLFETDIL